MPTTTPFNNLITFSRGSNATVTGSNGLIQWAPNNLLLQSESLDNASWTKQASTITANNTLAPDGTITADKIVEAATTAAHGVRQSAALSALVATLSFYAKKAEREFVNVWAFGGNIDTTATRAGFNLTTGVATIRPGQTATIQDVGNGWYRCSVSIILTAAGSPTVHIGPSIDALTQDYTGDGTSGAFIWGAQLELGSTATTYNPTTVKNLLGFSEAFDNAGWTKSGSSIVTGAQANPVNGAFNAQKLMEDTSTGQHRVFNTTGVTYIASTPVCFSAYVKAAERSFVYFRLNNSGADFVTGFVNLTTGAVTTVTGAGSITATSVGSGWWRIAAIGTSAAATPVSGYIATATSGSVVSYTGDGNSGVYIYGAQLSDSASLDPYVPTPGAAPSSTAFYGPRFDFDPVTLLPRGILIEEQRTNLLLRSEEFDNASWTKASTTVTANATISPDGALNADKVIVSNGITMGTSSAAGIRQTISKAASAITYTYTAFAKAGEFNSIFLFMSNAALSATARCIFNLAAGTASATTTVGAFTGTSATITAVGNGWYRCSLTTTTDTDTSLRCDIWPSDTVATTGNGTSGIFAFGAQLEAGAFATSYIPTVASTVTRSADVATITGQNFAQWYRQDEGALVADFDTTVLRASGTTVHNVASADAGSTANQIALYAYANFVAGRVNTGGVGQADINGGGSPANNVTIKSGIAYALNSVAVTVNGVTPGTDNTATVPTVDRLSLGHVGSSNQLNGHIRNIRFIPARAADFQLQALTT